MTFIAIVFLFSCEVFKNIKQINLIIHTHNLQPFITLFVNIEFINQYKQFRLFTFSFNLEFIQKLIYNKSITNYACNFHKISYHKRRTYKSYEQHYQHSSVLNRCHEKYNFLYTRKLKTKQKKNQEMIIFKLFFYGFNIIKTES